MKLRTTCLPIVAAALTLTGAASTSAGELRGRVDGASEASPAVVWVEGLPAAPVPDRDTVITHKDGKFEPHVGIGFVGNSFVLRNDDDTLHNTHLYLRLAYQKEASQRPLHYGATLFNVALPKAGMEVRKPVEPYHRYRDDTGFIEVVCNPHPDERAYVLVFDHPYAVVTGDDGSFAIPNLPAGKHEVRVWHAAAVTKGHEVTIEDGASTELVIEAAK